jgi:penicillin-binding protein 2
MPPPGEPRRSPLNQELAIRVAIVGSVVLALFAIVFFRLWFLQVLTGNQYVRAASVNQTRNVPIAPARGEILDRSGKVLVNSKTALAVTIVPRDLPVALDAVSALRPPPADRRVYARLAHVLHMPANKHHPCVVPEPPPSCNTTLGHCASTTTRRLTTIACDVATQLALSTYADVNIKQPIKQNIQFYLAERGNLFRGVEVQQISITGYPDEELAAQTLGTVGRITAAQTQLKSFKGVDPNAIIGQTGLEYQYDNYLRGAYGHQQVKINAAGQPTGHGKTVEPTAGENLQVSLDAQLQRVGQASLQQASEEHGNFGGAFVAMNPETGAVYGLGSYPYFKPQEFADGISAAQYKALNNPAANQPLFNRAISAIAPTGSTFKPITATAALQSGAWPLDKIYDDTGTFTIGTGASAQHRQNSGGASYGDVNLTRAIQVSDDDFFYNLGALTNADPSTHPDGGALQDWARKYGIGRNPGIDLPDAKAGTLPTPNWRAGRDKLEHECETATGEYTYVNAAGHISAHLHPGFHRNHSKPAACGIADGRPWSIGDNISLAVGQGDVQVTPLQLAVAYSAIANGGAIVRPHLGESIQSADGTVLQKIDPPPERHIGVNPTYLQAIQEGLHEAAQSPGGTSDDVMGDFGMPVYGKTGTAQYIPTTGPLAGVESDYAWYAAFVPATATSKPIVVVVWVENGNFGDIGAAPVARQILSQWFYGKPGPFKVGSNPDK